MSAVLLAQAQGQFRSSYYAPGGAMPPTKKANAKQAQPKRAKAAGGGAPPQPVVEHKAGPCHNAKLIDAMVKHMQAIGDHPAFAGVFTDNASEVGKAGSMADQEAMALELNSHVIQRFGFGWV